MKSVQSLTYQERVYRFLYILLFFFLFLMGRLFYIQILRGENYRRVSEANRTTLFFEQAPRGIILDRNGKVLADNQPTFVVLWMPIELKREVLATTVEKLSGLLRLKEGDLASRLKPAVQRVSLTRVIDRVPRDLAFSLMEHRPDLPGISVVTEMQRDYPQGSLASHLLGYLGKVTPEELENRLEEPETGEPHGEQFLGKMGLEKVYDSLLRGRPGGMRIEVDALGRPLKILDHQKPVAGYFLKTTIHSEIQKVAEDALSRTGMPGALLAMDPRNGEILAFVSSPEFDPNLFLRRGDEESGGLSSLLSSEEQPLFNRAVQGQYAPGSIFKIVVAAAALEGKKIAPEQNFYCPGYFWLGGPGGKKFTCWKKEGHGSLNLHDAVVHSCNVYFYNLGLRTGPDLMETMARRFALGSSTGLEFPGEKKGSIPGRTMFKTGKRRWFDGDTLNMAIGQGTILFTPLQAIQMVNLVATRGKLFRPHLLREIRNPAGDLVQSSPPEPLEDLSLSQETWDFLTQSLTDVVERGTGQSCKIAGIHVAGKTGTVQNPHGKDHAWFVAFAPSENPTISVSVIVEHGVKGSLSAAPIARDIFLAALSPTQ
ncbi:MAG: penicillin-binding protein 2 [Elusimicrobia bacterium]|nr:penicillin-binding protein 2 [Elusimicrobiota bacterium]